MKNKKLVIKQTTWNLSPLFASDEDQHIPTARKKVEKVNKEFVSKWLKNDAFLSDAKVLKVALDEFEKINRLYGTSGKEGYYFWLRTMQDQLDTDLKAHFAKVLDFSNKLENEIQFFMLRLAKVDKKKQKEFLKDPQLASYHHFLEKIFKQADYVLSENEEKIMTLKADPAYSKWTQMVSAFISKEERITLLESGKKEKKNLEGLASLTSSRKKKVRDGAAKGINDILDKYKEVAEAEMNAIMANKKVDDEIRNMPRPDFARHLGDDIESEVVDALLSSVAKRNDIAQKFYKLKAKLLGVKKLEYHERNIELTAEDKKFTFQNSADFVHYVFQQMDHEFSDILERFLRSGQIDVFPKKGKSGGAFCAYWLPTQPTYVLLNYTDKLNDVLTLAHEMGHAINNELMKQKQNSLNFGTPVATAECASTFMEDFVLQEILRTADEETQFGLMMTKLNSDISTIFRQVACYLFEQELHKTFREKGYLSHQEIGKIFQKHMNAYMGASVEQSPGSENWWIYWSHIRSFFYVYSYASGLLISKSMQNAVKENPDFIIKVKEFLSAGLSASPKDIFMRLGINIADATFWDKGLDEVEKLLNDTEKLAKKLKKIT
ncbi:MAG TPA: M3 family oligoendopeptidase [Candidatus Saccharimonadales bacterium]|nr:M3 family oligoendopeptidase [Candidatus Saccharimonadales bacterium]